MSEPRITDDAVERLRARVGVPEPWTRRPHYLRPNTDAFRNVAEAYGDDNPLYCDTEHAAASVWAGPLAPPPLVGGDSLIGEDEVTAVPETHRELMKGDPLRGVHAFYSASAREWWAPLRPERRAWRRNALVAVLDKPSEFAERAVHEWSANVFRDDDGTLLAGQYRLMIRTERAKAREKKKYAAIELASYTDAEIDAIEAEYAAYRRRGDETRWWEDVQEADTIGPMVKGPLTVTDMVCWHVGMGMGLYDVKPLALGAANRRRIPRFFHRDDQNVPDVMQRVHWDPEWARRAGNPTTYDYGRMRETWLIHLCTDWMGDDAWLWRLECEFRGFNYVGDTHHLTGTVVRRYLADGARPAVDVELAAVNQRGTVTTPGTATVLLPSREHGPVRLPDPPGGATDLEQALTAAGDAFFAAMSVYESVPGLDVSLVAGVLTLRFARPEKRNALNDTMTYAAIDAVDHAGRDEAVRAILLTGAGDHFCSGFDIVARNREEGRPRVGSIQRRLPSQAHRLVPLLCSTQVPVVCAVRGWAAGIGLNLALAADFTVAATDARFWTPFVERGFTPDSGSSWLLPRRVGEMRAREMVMLGRVVDGAEAAEWRMIHRAVPEAEVDAVTAELVTKLAGSATVALGLAKWLMYTGATSPLDDQLRNEAFAMELSSRSEDFREGLEAFQAKRPPEYKGR